MAKHTTSHFDYREVGDVPLPAPPVVAVPLVSGRPEVEPLPVVPGVAPWPGMPGGTAAPPVALEPLPMVDELLEPMPPDELVLLGVVAEVELLGVVAEVEPEPMVEEPDVRVPAVPHAASTKAHAKGMVHFNIRIS